MDFNTIWIEIATDIVGRVSYLFWGSIKSIHVYLLNRVRYYYLVIHMIIINLVGIVMVLSIHWRLYHWKDGIEIIYLIVCIAGYSDLIKPVKVSTIFLLVSS